MEKSEPKVKEEIVPFKEILKGVRIALSGFVNPERSRIRFRASIFSRFLKFHCRALFRDQALAMGAGFDRDLSRMTTHLVCAFENTPKAKKFKDGFIIKKEWITIQHATKRRHNWRKYSWKKEDYDSEDEDLYFKQE